MPSITPVDDELDARLAAGEFEDVYGDSDEEEEAVVLETKSRRHLREQALADWKLYFEEQAAKGNTAKMPGNPKNAEDVFDPAAPELDASTIASFLVYCAKGINAVPKGQDGVVIPSILTMEKKWSGFLGLLLFRRRQPLGLEVRRAVHSYLQNDMVNAELVTKEVRQRTFTDVNGLEALTRAILNPTFSATHPRGKVQMILYQSLEVDTGSRGCAHYPPKARDDNEGFMAHKHFEVVVRRPQPDEAQSRNKFALRYTVPRHKTITTEGAVITIEEATNPWHCGVRSYLTVATLDGVLPYSVEEMASPDFLGSGQAERRIECLASERERPVCVTEDGKTWCTYIVINSLVRLSELAGFERPIGMHSYRRMVALYMSQHGDTPIEIAMKLGHRLLSNVTNTYMGQMPGADVSAVANGGPKLLQHMIGLHPEAVSATPGVPVAVLLSAKDRRDVLQSQERRYMYCSILTCSRRRSQQG